MDPLLHLANTEEVSYVYHYQIIDSHLADDGGLLVLAFNVKT